MTSYERVHLTRHQKDFSLFFTPYGMNVLNDINLLTTIVPHHIETSRLISIQII